ncbi:MAG: tol-pal system protein YbgF [Pseudomonadales bacterium]|nr:tol-pal system protein YbgF [Pseudomonadales bacterium]
MNKRLFLYVVLTGWIYQPVFADGQQNSIAAELLIQVQQLQQEVLELRGLAEEQAHQLKRLKDTQRDHYLDLDRRISTLQRQGSQVSTKNPSQSSSKVNYAKPAIETTAVVPIAIPKKTSADSEKAEQKAYDQAYGLVKSKKFEQASDGFRQLLVDYPNGKYAPNAHYWLGELFMVDSDLENAAKEFSKVVTLYPEHWKSADAFYKLGEIYFRLDDTGKSRQYLERAIKDFPDSTAARFSSRYLKANFPQ